MTTSKKIIILDRDGVINYDSLDYIKSPDELVLIPGSANAIAKLNSAGYRVVIATNQSGIARQFYDKKMLDKIHEKLHKELATVNARIDAIFYCPHHPEDDCACRKPKAGLLFAIAKQYAIDLSTTFFIGDNVTDLEAAFAAQCKPMMVLTGFKQKQLDPTEKFKNVPRFADLAAAVTFILEQNEDSHVS